MAYQLGPIEACEPSFLPADPDVEVSGMFDNGTMCGAVTLTADDPRILRRYFLKNFGGEEDGEPMGWAQEVLDGMQEVERRQSVWNITDSPGAGGQILGTYTGITALEALDGFAIREGFAPYSALIRDRVDDGPWLYYIEIEGENTLPDLILGGPFTNHEVFAHEVQS